MLEYTFIMLAITPALILAELSDGMKERFNSWMKEWSLDRPSNYLIMGYMAGFNYFFILYILYRIFS